MVVRLVLKGMGDVFLSRRRVWLFAYGVGLSLHSWWSVCLRRLSVCLRCWPFLAFLVVCLPAALVCVRTALAFPCILIGLLASPLCGAAPTFFAAAKKVGKESGLTPLVLRCPSRFTTGNGPTRDVPSRNSR
jgi:hypothetical protein